MNKAAIRYPRILNAIKNEIWAIRPSFLQSIASTLRSSMLGNLSQAEQPLTVTAATTYINADGEVIEQERGSLAVVSIQGVIAKYLTDMETMCGGCSLEQVEQELVAAAEDDTVSNILLHIDSPGGGVTGVPELAKLISKIDREVKPVYAFSDSIAASAAYWLASATRGIFITETADVGSIGVYVAYIDESEWMAKEGYKLELFKAGKHKAAGLSGAEMSAESRELIQSQVDQVYNIFTSFVSQERPQIETDSMEGQTFMGLKAMQAGLADEVVESFNEVIEAIA